MSSSTFNGISRIFKISAFSPPVMLHSYGFKILPDVVIRVTICLIRIIPLGMCGHRSARVLLNLVSPKHLDELLQAD